MRRTLPVLRSKSHLQPFSHRRQEPSLLFGAAKKSNDAAFGDVPQSWEATPNLLPILSELRKPVRWYKRLPNNEPRNIIMHVGPTNSGKTHHALNSFFKAKSGVYCAPLRLLALEIWDRTNRQGTPCRLVTGEERRDAFYDQQQSIEKPVNSPELILPDDVDAFRLFDDVKHIACTIEMLRLSQSSDGSSSLFEDPQIDVAVIDEIQMMADPARGWAWTQALLGVPARNVHLCGEATAIPLVKSMCEAMGEKVEVREYRRLNPLEMENKSLDGKFRGNIQSGDCMIAFSRREIFELKEKIEQSCGLRCAVVYGGLPPETRNEQARLFNDPNSGYDILVASDAVGMGLNLNIRRIIFSSTAKFDGEKITRLSLSQVKQIGGRAGRFGLSSSQANEAGKVTTLYAGDLNFVRKSLDANVKILKQAGLRPTLPIIQRFAEHFPECKFYDLLDRFEQVAVLGQQYFLSDMSDAKIAAKAIDRFHLSLQDRFTLSCAPIRAEVSTELNALKEMAAAVSQSSPDSERNPGLSILDMRAVRRSWFMTSQALDLLETVSEEATQLKHAEPTSLKTYLKEVWPLPQTPAQLVSYEGLHRVLTLYLWLNQRYPKVFYSDVLAASMKRYLEVLIDQGLRTISHVNRYRRQRKGQVDSEEQ